MENQEDIYLLFTAGEFYFLSPLFFVKEVSGADEDDGEEVTLAAVPFSRKKDKRAGDEKYKILLECEGLEFGILADEVLGVFNVEAEKALPLERSLLNDRNAYLEKVVPLNTGREEILAYTMNLVTLKERYLNQNIV